MTPATTATKPSAAQLHRRIEANLQQVVAVTPEVLHPLVLALVSGGHALVEGVPGTGKTLLVRALARCCDCDFSRVQFTNDLMPSDIVGSMVWKPRHEEFEYVRGPLFANLVLADEINRTSPRTLSCLLEAMERGHISVDGKAVPLGHPFTVLATRNPIEFHGTFPVPEAALDRFLVRVEIGYPEPSRELALYTDADGDPEGRLDDLPRLITREELQQLQAQVAEIHVSEPVARYAYAVVQATRQHEHVLLGASPRAALAWLRAARAQAMLEGRDHALPDDLKQLAHPVLGHRIFMRGSEDAAELISQVVDATPVEL